MAVQAAEPNLQQLHSRFRAARRGYWAEIASLTFALSFCVGGGIALVAALLQGWQAPGTIVAWFWMAAAAAPLAGLLATIALRPSMAEAVRILDLRLGLRQQLGTAEELLARGATGRLVPLQIARAETLAEDLPVGEAFHLLPRRELLLAGALGATTALVLVLASLGITLPNPLSVIRLTPWGAQQAGMSQPVPAGNWRQAEAPRPRSAAMEPARGILDQLQKQAQQGSLSAAAAAASVAQASAELNRIAAQSRLQQEALETLANELRETAAGREAAESLRQGDYEKAASQLRDIGRENDQLSAAAKTELSQALSRAASQAQSSPDLSRSANRAAEALEEKDYSTTAQAMDQLARSVDQAANRLVPQSELAESWQQLEDISRQFGDVLPQIGNSTRSLSPPMAQATQGTMERQMDSGQQGSAGAPGIPGDPSMAFPGMGESMAGMGQGAAGDSSGGEVLGGENNPLGVEGNPLDVEGKVGSNITPGSDPSSQAPTVLREGKGNSSATPDRGVAGGPVSVPAESVYVPGDRRPVIRDYFSKGAGSQ